MKKQWTRVGVMLLGAAAVAGALTACVPLVVGGGAVTTALVASDRRTSGMYIEDEAIEHKAAAQVRPVLVDGGRVNATSYNRMVLLTGEVRTEAQKAEIGTIVAGIANVSDVINDLEVVPFVSSISQRTRDTVITSQVKASLINAKDLQAHTIKVVTELNVVYLMGIVSERESKRAAEIARGVNHVRKVVRVFEIVPEESLASTNLQPE